MPRPFMGMCAHAPAPGFEWHPTLGSPPGTVRDFHRFEYRFSGVVSCCCTVETEGVEERIQI